MFFLLDKDWIQTVSAIYHDITKDLTPEEKVQMQKDLLQFTGNSMDDEHQARSAVAKLKTVNKYLLKTVRYVLTFLPLFSCFYRRLPSIWRRRFTLSDLSSTRVLILMHGQWVSLLLPTICLSKPSFKKLISP